MPLPPALAARLAKRGIVAKEEPKKVLEKVVTLGATGNAEEEVFAEDYDDPVAMAPDMPQPVLTLPPPMVVEEEPEDTTPDNLIFETSACPNMTNPFHECCKFCKDKWGVKKFEHKSGLEHKHERVLRKYPLPDGWFEVGDPSTSRFYYWHADSDHVCWLPPLHPRAHITQSANKLRESLPSADITSEVEDLGAAAAKPAETPMEEDFEEPDFEEMERELLKEKKKKERKREGRSRRERKVDQDTLDPMDPASYSDIARGGWSAGLDIPGSAKTGVDSTASGPLFQQRPYPSPGAVLRANADSKPDTPEKSIYDVEKPK